MAGSRVPIRGVASVHLLAIDLFGHVSAQVFITIGDLENIYSLDDNGS